MFHVERRSYAGRLLADAELREYAIEDIVDINPPGYPAKSMGSAAQVFGAKHVVSRISGGAHRNCRVGEGGTVAGMGNQRRLPWPGNVLRPVAKRGTQGGQAIAGQR